MIDMRCSSTWRAAAQQDISIQIYQSYVVVAIATRKRQLSFGSDERLYLIFTLIHAFPVCRFFTFVQHFKQATGSDTLVRRSDAHTHK